VLDRLLPVGLCFGKDVVDVAKQRSPSLSTQSQPTNHVSKGRDALDVDGEGINVPQPSIGDARHDHRPTPIPQRTIIRRKHIWQERPITPRGERDDDVDLARLGVFEEFGSPGVDGVDVGCFGGDGGDERPVLEVGAAGDCKVLAGPVGCVC
jgi:hypothetical protein